MLSFPAFSPSNFPNLLLWKPAAALRAPRYSWQLADLTREPEPCLSPKAFPSQLSAVLPRCSREVSSPVAVSELPRSKPTCLAHRQEPPTRLACPFSAFAAHEGPVLALGRVEAGLCGAASAEPSGGRVLAHSQPRCPVSAVSPVLSGPSHCRCAETILPSSLVGLLTRLPCAVPQPHGLTHPEPLPGRRGCRRGVGQGARRAAGTGPGLPSALRHECDVLPAQPHVIPCFFCG